MKVIFNILIVAVVVAVLWSALSWNRQGADANVSATGSKADLVGAVIQKSCKNYFRKPMSVVYDRETDVLYISNVVDEQEKKGFVCRISMTGELLDTLRIEDLGSPKGMTLLDNSIYIADVNRVFRYNLMQDSVVKVYNLPKAMFLSDVTNDQSGRIYVSDSFANCIYVIDGDSSRVFCSDSLCLNVSGLCMDGTSLIAGARNRILSIDSAGHATEVASVGFSVHGIRSDDCGNYIVSDFVGNVYAVSGDRRQLLIRKQGNANAAQLEYIPDQKLMFVPTYAGNSMDIYEVGDYLR